MMRSFSDAHPGLSRGGPGTDEAEGVVWPAPRIPTQEECEELDRFMRLCGKAAAEEVDCIRMEAMGLK